MPLIGGMALSFVGGLTQRQSPPRMSPAVHELWRIQPIIVPQCHSIEMESQGLIRTDTVRVVGRRRE